MGNLDLKNIGSDQLVDGVLKVGADSDATPVSTAGIAEALLPSEMVAALVAGRLGSQNLPTAAPLPSADGPTPPSAVALGEPARDEKLKGDADLQVWTLIAHGLGRHANSLWPDGVLDEDQTDGWASELGAQ
jgi:hypothetical protein